MNAKPFLHVCACSSFDSNPPAHSGHGDSRIADSAARRRPVVSRLHQELSRILHASDVIQALLARGLEVWTMTPDAFGAYIRSEAEKWTRVIRETGINET